MEKGWWLSSLFSYRSMNIACYRNCVDVTKGIVCGGYENVKDFITDFYRWVLCVDNVALSMITMKTP